MLTGQRTIQPRTVRLLEDLEALQPAPMTYPVRLLLIHGPELSQAGTIVRAPKPRSRFEANWDWSTVFAEAEAQYLVVEWNGAYCLTELGVRCRDFLSQLAARTASHRQRRRPARRSA
jgi:hypothetical protein